MSPVRTDAVGPRRPARAALATAGSGDVKAGAVVAFCARGAAVEQAASWAAHCHGVAGDRLGKRMPGFLARDVVRELTVRPRRHRGWLNV